MGRPITPTAMLREFVVLSPSCKKSTPSEKKKYSNTNEATETKH
jgi:hypothetical protein